MQQEPPTAKPTRRPRADGERNRTRLIAAAKRACAERGAAVSLEHIAREADVSIATLYRHFPTRDELISAVYQQEVDMLIEAADQLMMKREPATALREWLMLFVGFLDAKHGMAEAMDTLIGGPEPLYSRTPHRLDLPIKALVAGGVTAGVFRDDIEPRDLLRALAGVAHVRPSEKWKNSAVRMVDLLMKGMQSTSSSAKKRRRLMHKSCRPCGNTFHGWSRRYAREIKVSSGLLSRTLGFGLFGEERMAR